MKLSSRQTGGKLHSFRKDQRGVAAIEFAFLVGFLSLAMLNVTDVATYLYQRMEVENSAEMGAAAAFKTCDQTHVPATTNCTGLSAAVTAAVQATSLGTNVTLQSGSPSEGWYCVNSSGVLQLMTTTMGSKPSNCSAAGMASLQPGDYVKVQVTYTYTPIFTGISVGGLLPATVTKTTLVRMQ